MSVLFYLQITVQQLKEKVRETLGIEINLQRLIFCGRVLQDEKKLADYGELLFFYFIIIGLINVNEHKRAQFTLHQLKYQQLLYWNAILIVHLNKMRNIFRAFP